ncbi:MAG: hypothetical protein AW12_00859 [Candidatus Accumulibacter sp. BA-94]|uniref:VpaChn25_0724 family phage protein n=1 Tax=Accumulibacter sp. TaxID=2053492 RepID=UPI000450C805|nr:ArsR family transcriptional regulator [Accumulibacter sp.]EXI92116.1 MAG: hypothetical protein AW12_00859 [Candidatus Accumulibacter sp. BA-94]HRD86804.1 ArsR family transcriptional regulator [Accumulibacter sp.]
MNFGERLREEARLQMLVCLAGAPDYTVADSVLQAALRDQGVSVSLAALRGDLSWLDEQGMLVTQRPGGAMGLTIATLTTRGLDVAHGLSFPPGVARPRPGA